VKKRPGAQGELFANLDGSSPGNPPVQLVRSSKRRRTYKWSLVGGQVRLEVPAGLRSSDETRIVAEVAEQARRRLARAQLPSDQALLKRARELASQHVPEAVDRLRSVAWSDRQAKRWGSCSGDTGDIRLSSRLRGLPNYVLEAVLLHEIAHLLEPNHSSRFQSLANRYPLAERARGFLEAVDRDLRAAGDDWADHLD
jgi:predicted metal-dependent hydrolase